MTIEGRVTNGVVVLPPGTNLEEGQVVRVTLQGKKGTHSVMDIPKFSVGKILDYHPEDEDILGEMLEGRKI